eukprot:5745541-Pleurochrysis_carterae.AAC.2
MALLYTLVTEWRTVHSVCTSSLSRNSYSARYDARSPFAAALNSGVLTPTRERLNVLRDPSHALLTLAFLSNAAMAWQSKAQLLIAVLRGSRVQRENTSEVSLYAAPQQDRHVCSLSSSLSPILHLALYDCRFAP